MPPRKSKAKGDDEPRRKKRTRGEEDVDPVAAPATASFTIPGNSSSAPGPSSTPSLLTPAPLSTPSLLTPDPGFAIPPPQKRHRRGLEFEGQESSLPSIVEAPTTDSLALDVPPETEVTESPVRETFGPADPKVRKRPQGASVAMDAARPFFRIAQRHILAGFTHKDVGRHCGCGAAAAATIYRCHECFKSPLYCKDCIVRVHKQTPFHHIEEWNGTYFARISLRSLGLVIYTCQTEAGRCPQVSEKSRRRQNMVLVEYNGVHEIEIEYCDCTPGIGKLADSDVDQLLDLRLFPATFTKTKTVFTWTVMKQFHIHSLASKKSAYDYIKALNKLTDNVFPKDIKDRYREFGFAYRIWRFLALERRTGQAHGIDAYVLNRRPNSLTVRCPACPEVGFNISEETMKAALETEKHKYTLFLSVDGNFKLQRKNKRDDPDDVALNRGNSYFVETEEYKRYLSLVKPSEDLSTCSHLRAARMQNIAKFKNAVISGVVAVQCARHGFYLPQAMVDLKKGEAFANTDYAVAHSLGEAALLQWIMYTYDIWCQYSARLRERFTEWFPSMVWIIDMIRGAIPKMHIHGHIELCQLLWNLNWLTYSAFTVGEMIETGWAEHNLTAGSTKEQNDGNQHDSVDDTSGSWNWDKLIGLALALQRLYRIAKAELRTRSANFEALTESHKPEWIEEWKAMDVEQKMEGKGKDRKLKSVFQVNFARGPPTHAAAYAKLVREELQAEADVVDAEEEDAEEEDAEKEDAEEEDAGVAGKSAVESPVVAADGSTKKAGDSALITSGMLVEKDQHHVQRMISQHADGDLIDAGRRRLFNSITNLRTRIVARVPSLEKQVVDVDPERPEKDLLFMPSCFTAESRNKFSLGALAQVEYELRMGQAFDALGEIRTAIKTLNWNLQIKREAIHGSGPLTKAQNFLRTLSNDIQLAADTYRRARAALVMLGMPEDHPTLKTLQKSDLFGKSGQQVLMGDSKLRDSWFWTTARPENMSDAEEEQWEKELDRVKWFRERALRDRAIEEVETLECEFARAIEAFGKNSEIWKNIAAKEEELGARAYAFKQAGMYKKLCDKCKEAFDETPKLIEADRIAAEKKAEKRRREEEEARKRYEAEHGPDFSAYYETIDI